MERRSDLAQRKAPDGVVELNCHEAECDACIALRVVSQTCPAAGRWDIASKRPKAGWLDEATVSSWPLLT